MADKIKIGAGLALDGEKEFKQAIRDINKDLTVLGTEMGKVTAQFGSNANTMEGLTAKQQVYNKQIEEQKNKIEILKQALANSAKEFGENDNKTKEWQIALNRAEAQLSKTENALQDTTDEMEELGEESGKTKKELKEAGETAEKSGGKFEKLGGILKTAGVALGGIAAAAGTAAFKLGKEVIQQFGELEQNLGGSEAVFGKYAEKVQKTGEDAYKNMGVSQSQYLQTANVMGALFQGSGIEQEKSLVLTEKAMQRAADMASVMGIDMQMALDSVAGAAKGNFTMMDNLGVAMNATNIEAYALAKGLDFTWKSASQAEKAEVAMQMFFENTEQYAGNFAKESTETVSGAFGLWGAALESWIGGLGNAEADMTNLTKNLTDAFKAVVSNVVPIIRNLTDALPVALDALLEGISELLPDLLSTAISLFKQVLDTILKLLPELIPVAVAAVMTIVDTVIDNIPLLIDGALLLILGFANGIIEALPELIPVAVDAILTIAETLVNNIDTLIDASIAIVLGLTNGIIEALPMLVERAPEIIIKLVETIIKNLPKIIEAGVQIIVALGGALVQAIPQLVSKVPEIILSIVVAFRQAWPKIKEIGSDIVKGVWQGIQAMAKWIKEKVGGFFGGIIKDVKGLLGIKSPSTIFAGIGENMALGLGEGFSTEMDSIGKDIGSSIPTDFEFNGSLNNRTIEHKGTLRVEGVSGQGELLNVVDIVMDNLRWEARMA